MGNNLKAIVKVMRLAIGRGKSRLNITELMDPALEWIRYPMNHALESKINRLHSEDDVRSFIPYCQYMASEEFACDLFDPVITDSGICYAFNPTPTLDTLNPSYFTESFAEAFKSFIR